MSHKAGSRKQDQFVLRLPDGMRERIKAEAERNNRSMNAEILSLLEVHFPPEPTIDQILVEIELILPVLKATANVRSRQLTLIKLEAAREALKKSIRPIEAEIKSSSE